MPNDNGTPPNDGTSSRFKGESVPEDTQTVESDTGSVAAANLVNDPPTDTTVMLPCMHWGTVSHKTGDRLVRCHCGQEAVIRAVQRTVTKYVVAQTEPELPLGMFD
jgi:hypothetical protein